MSQHCAQLRSLRGNLEGLDDEVLVQIAAGCPLLETFDVPRFYGSGPGPGLRAIALKGCLRELSVQSVTAEILHLSPQLRRVNMYHCDNSPARITHGLVSHCYQLRELKVLTPKAVLVFDQPAAYFIRNHPLLEVLELGVTSGMQIIIELGAHCHHLRKLVLRRFLSTLDDACITALAQGCPELRELSMRIAGTVTMAGGIAALATHCPRLKRAEVALLVLGQTHVYGQRVLSGRKLVVVRPSVGY
jgi:hypothetical protein